MRNYHFILLGVLSLSLAACSSSDTASSTSEFQIRSADALSNAAQAAGLVKLQSPLPSPSMLDRQPSLSLQSTSTRIDADAELTIPYALATEDASSGQHLFLQFEGASTTLRIDHSATTQSKNQSLRIGFNATIDLEKFCADLIAQDSHGRYSNRQRFCVATTQQNPISNAGADGHLRGGQTYTLDGSGSLHAENANFLWEEISGLGVQFDNPQAASTTFTAPNSASVPLEIRLTVTDSGGVDSDKLSFLIEDSSTTNQAPLASAGPDQTADEGSDVTLYGDGGDSDGNVALYSWEQTAGSQVELASSENGRVVNFTAPEISAGSETLSFTLTVTDNEDAQTTDSLSVNVQDLDSPPPVARAGDDFSADEGSVVRLNGSQSSPEGLSYIWTQKADSFPKVSLRNAQSASAEFDAPLVEEDTNLVFVLTVSNGEGGSDSDEVSVTLINDPFDTGD